MLIFQYGIINPSTEEGKSVFVRILGFSTICQGTQEKSCPPAHFVIYRQTCLGFENRSVVNFSKTLSLHSEKNLGSAVLDRLPKKDWELKQTQPSQREIPEHKGRGGGKSLDAMEIIRINLPSHPQPTLHRLNYQAAVTSSAEEKDSGECLTPVVQNAAREVHFSQVATRVQDETFMTRWEKSRKRQIRISKGICRGRAVQDDSIKDLKLTSSHKYTKFTATDGWIISLQKRYGN